MDLLIILGKNKISFDVLTSDQGLEVSTATYGPEIDQPQHMKSASHIIRYNTCTSVQHNIYLLLAGCEVCMASYELSFFPCFYGPSMKHAGHENRHRKSEDP